MLYVCRRNNGYQAVSSALPPPPPLQHDMPKSSSSSSLDPIMVAFWILCVCAVLVKKRKGSRRQSGEDSVGPPSSHSDVDIEEQVCILKCFK